MKIVKGFRCIRCGEHLPLRERTYTCKYCGGNLDVRYDYELISRHISKDDLASIPGRSIWRYAVFLPVERLEYVTNLMIGGTPLYRAYRLGKELGMRNLFIKDDSLNPSASFKDRASAVVLARALEEGAKRLACASTGNAGCSLACLCANVGIPCSIFVPASAPQAKLVQIEMYGAEIIRVDGTYDEAYDLCKRVCLEKGWYNRSTGYNPFTREGKKTVSYEICEELFWDPPDRVVVPVGDGNIISGVWKGFCDLYSLGFINRLPRLVAVQAAGSNAISQAFGREIQSLRSSGTDNKRTAMDEERKKIQRRTRVKGQIQPPNQPLAERDFIPFSTPMSHKIQPIKAETFADSISVDLPRDGEAAVKALLESNGLAVEVTDDEIRRAMKLLATTMGIFAEPTGAASIAGLSRIVSEMLIHPQERVVCLVTGSGLKDVKAALETLAATRETKERSES